MSASARVKDFLHQVRSMLESIQQSGQELGRSPFRKKLPSADVPEQVPEQPSPRVSKEELQTMLRDMLADPAANPELTSALRAALLGPLMPIGAGMPCTTTPQDIGPGGEFGASCSPAGDYSFAANLGIGTATPGKRLTVSDASQVIAEVGDATVTDLEGTSVRLASRLYPLPLGSAAYSAGQYAKIDPVGVNNQLFALLVDLTGNQPDGVGGAARVNHHGHGNAFYVLLRGTGASAFEAASFVDSAAAAGSKGIISTIQAASPNQNNVLFNALWENATVPLYGMIYADQSPGNAITVRKFTSANDAQSQIRVWENDLSRERFSVLNDGTIRAASLNASSGAQLRNSPPVTLRGAYWNGADSVDQDWKLQNTLFSTSAPRSRLSVQDPAGNERVVVRDDGNVGIGISAPAEKLEVAGNVKITGSGNGLKFPDGTTQVTAAQWSDGAGNDIFYATGKVIIGATTGNKALTVADTILSQVTGDVRNFVLDQTQAGLKRTAIEFQAVDNGTPSTPQFLLGVDQAGNGTRNLFLFDSVSGATRILVDPHGNVGIGTTAPAKKLSVVEGTEKLQEVGIATTSSPVEGGITTRAASRLYQVGLGSPAQSQSAALYIEVDTGGNNNIFGIVGEVKSQPDGYGGFMKIAHKGAGDAIFVPLYTSKGVALEAATNLLHDSQNPTADGTKGVISTLQAATPSTRPNQKNTLFQALWENEHVPTYGMFYADQAPGNAFKIQKYTTASNDETQISLWENGLGRDRFAVLNDGTVRVSSLAAAAAPNDKRNSPPFVLRAAHWTGSASADRDWKMTNEVTQSGGTPAYRLSFRDNGNNVRFVILDSGDICIPTIGTGLILKSPNGNCFRLKVANNGNLSTEAVTPCP